MKVEAEAGHHGAIVERPAADLLQPTISSPSPSLSYSSADDDSFRSSAAWSVDEESDDDYVMDRPIMSECEEIPSFRWMPSELWPRRTRKRTGLSEKTRTTKLEHFHGRLLLTFDQLQKTGSVRTLGKGSYGEVYTATLADGKQVAVRRPRSAAIRGDAFEAEVNVLRNISHPNLVALLAHSWEDEMLLFFEYVPKGSLSAFLHAGNRDTTIDWLTRMKIAIGITTGLLHLHTMENMVHGRLTSGNVLLDDHTNAKIADFGLRRLINSAADDKKDNARAFRAPEFSKSKFKEANTKTDVYSLGVIILELLTGMSPSDINLPRMRSDIRTYQVFDDVLIRDAVEKTGGELLDTLFLALHCVHTSPDARPTVLQVLQKLEEIKPEVARPIGTSTPKGGHKPIEDATTTANAYPTTGVLDVSSSSSSDMEEERITLTFDVAGIGTSESSAVSVSERNLRTSMTEDIISSLLLSPASGAEAMPTSVQEFIQGHSDNEELRSPSLGDVGAPPHAEDQSLATHVEAIAEEFVTSMPSWTGDSYIILSTPDHPEGNNRAPFPSSSKDEFPEPELAPPTEEADPSRELEEAPKILPIATRTGEGSSADGIDSASRGLAVIPLASINWSEVTLEARLEVPSSPPLMSSEPDLVYQRYFQTLHELANRSPPVPFMAMQVQLNQMIMGLHSLGYPLDTWLRAATLVLVSGERREHIERYVDGHKVPVEAQLAEFASAISPVKEEISRMKSHITTQELKQEELQVSIAKLENQLGVLKAQREEVSNSLATARDQLMVAETKMESLSSDMDSLNQQYSRISDFQSAMLCELPPRDEVFDPSFQDIMATKF